MVYKNELQQQYQDIGLANDRWHKKRGQPRRVGPQIIQWSAILQDLKLFCIRQMQMEEKK